MSKNNTLGEYKARLAAQITNKNFKKTFWILGVFEKFFNNLEQEVKT